MVDIVLQQVITNLGIAGLGILLMYRLVKDNLNFTKEVIISEMKQQREEHRDQIEKLNFLCNKKKPLKD